MMVDWLTRLVVARTKPARDAEQVIVGQSQVAARS
jgi:hypothetical protein